MFGCIDEPTNGKIIDSNDLTCKGWVYLEKGIKAIEIILDDTNIGRGKCGLRRDDVKKTLSDYGGIEKSGFYFYKHILLEDGVHFLLLYVFGNDGNYEELETVKFTVDKNIAAIERLNIELTNYCNLNCRWCAGSGSRRKGYMDFSLFKSIIDQLTSEKVSVSEIHIYNVGESLLHPNFCDFLKYLGKTKERPKCIMVTNATVLSKDLADCIISSEGLDFIQFSVDGGTKESYEWLRRGANWESTLKNISNFIDKNKGRVKTSLITIDLGVEFSEEFKNLMKRVDYAEVRQPHDWTGQEKLDGFNMKRSFNPNPCWHIRNNLVILWNGDVTVCCADLHGRGVIGNIKNDNIFGLWKGRRLKMFRLQAEGKKKEIALCKCCSIK